MEAATTMAQAHLGAVEWLQSTLNQTTAHGVARQGPNHSWVFVDLSKCPRWLQMLQIILMSTPNKPRGCGKWECHFRKSSDLVVGTPWSLNRGSLIQDWYSFIPSKNWASLRLNHTEPRHPHHMSHPPSGPRYQRLQTPESDRVGYAELHSAAIDLPAQRQTASRQEIGMKWWSSNYHSK